ncbi:MAG TPA: histidine kinase [Gaiellaceae bacterium]|nr:histidine kinase [Gaiellaceae bacterium]
MTRIEQVARTYWLDLLVVLLAVSAVVELLVTQDQPKAPSTTLWFLVPAVAMLALLPTLVRRRYPLGAAAAFWLLGAAISVVDGRLFASVESLFVLGVVISFMLGNLPNPAQARIGLAVAIGSAALVVYNIPENTLAEVIFVPLVFGSCWLAGYLVRERAERAEAAEVRALLAEREREAAEREREAAARVAVAEERARIARELHDVVAHAVSMMVLQVGAVRQSLLDGQAVDAETLHVAERMGRTALAEMRQLLGAMRRNGDAVEFAPQPGLGDLRALVDEVSRAGLPVHLHVDGNPIPLSRARGLSAYRIVQEGITNALKHASASRVDVTLRYAPDELDIEVRDDGRGTSRSDGLGHGLVGIRERVKIFGGEMSAGAAPEGGFVLRTRLPLGDEAS